MQVVMLDAETLGLEDLDFRPLEAVAEGLSCYQNTQPDEVLDRLAQAQVVLVNKVILDASCLSQLPHLKHIIVLATGVNNIDLQAAKQLGISRAQSQDYIGRYFTRYPGVQEYMDHTKTTAAEQGYVETLYGRRLYLPDIKASNAIARQASERTAINAPMQGTAADIIKRAMIKVDDWLASSGLNARMTMQVHDELIFEVDAHQVDALVSVPYTNLTLQTNHTV